MSLVDAQARKLVPLALLSTYKVVLEDGIDTLERYRHGIAYLHSNYGLLDEVTGQEIYGFTYVVLSEDREAIRLAAAKIGETIGTEL